MRITMRGYARDHGSWILIEEDLEKRFYTDSPSAGCPQKGFVLEEKTSEDAVVASLTFKQRVRVNMNGNYILEISLTPSDVARLCWFAFRTRALNVLLRIFGGYEAREIEFEEMAAQQRERRRLRRI